MESYVLLALRVQPSACPPPPIEWMKGTEGDLMSCEWDLSVCPNSQCACRNASRMPLISGMLAGNVWDLYGCSGCCACSRMLLARASIERLFPCTPTCSVAERCLAGSLEHAPLGPQKGVNWRKSALNVGLGKPWPQCRRKVCCMQDYLPIVSIVVISWGYLINIIIC